MSLPPRLEVLTLVGPASPLRTWVHSALVGIAHHLGEVETLAAVELGSPDMNRRHVLVVCVEGEKGLSKAAPIAAFRRIEPLVPIVVCLSHDDRLVAMRVDYFRSGIDAWFVTDRSVRAAQVRVAVQVRLEHALPRAWSPFFTRAEWNLGIALEQFCARNAYWPIRLDRVADLFEIDRATLRRNAKHVGWKTARALSSAARLVHVAERLEAGITSPSVMAKSLLFPEPAALHHLVKGRLQMTLQTLRLSGASGVVSHVWSERMEDGVEVIDG